MSKETLARAANSSDLEMEPEVIRDVDRIAAMAGGDALGSLLLRYRESEQQQWGKRIVLILARRLADKFRLTRSMAQRVAAAALIEFRYPHCVDCRGARVMMLDQVKIVCQSCQGSGLQRFDNAVRRQRIGTYGTRIDAAMAEAHRDMSNALRALLSHVAGRLE